MNYILENGKPKAIADIMEWATWFEAASKSGERVVEKTEVGGYEVSTVFLGIDHQFGDGPPLLFETMVFGGDLDEEMDRYSTWEDAEHGHAAMVERVRGKKPR